MTNPAGSMRDHRCRRPAPLAGARQAAHRRGELACHGGPSPRSPGATAVAPDHPSVHAHGGALISSRGRSVDGRGVLLEPVASRALRGAPSGALSGCARLERPARAQDDGRCRSASREAGRQGGDGARNSHRAAARDRRPGTALGEPRGRGPRGEPIPARRARALRSAPAVKAWRSARGRALRHLAGLAGGQTHLRPGPTHRGSWSLRRERRAAGSKPVDQPERVLQHASGQQGLTSCERSTGRREAPRP